MKSVRYFQAASHIALACAAILSNGCNSSQQSTYAPVTGVVTLDGKPIDQATLVFTCENFNQKGPQPTTRGVTDETGHFTLRSLTSEKELVAGALVGKHRVSIITRIIEQDEAGNTQVVRRELLSKRYADGTKLATEIPPEGIEDLRFDLNSE